MSFWLLQSPVEQLTALYYSDFEMITLNQIGYHKKPSAILNIDGFYDKLLEFIDQLINEGFIHPAHRAALIVSDSIEEILDKMEKYKNLHAEKWINA